MACFALYCFSRCTLRFPSTNVKITFQVLHGSADNTTVTSSAAVPVPSPAKPLQPLRISIPKPCESVSVFASPCPSPTGTIRFVLHLESRNVFVLCTVSVVLDILKFHFDRYGESDFAVNTEFYLLYTCVWNYVAKQLVV